MAKPTEQEWEHITRRYFDMHPTATVPSWLIELVEDMHSTDFETKQRAVKRFIGMMSPCR